MSTATRSKTTGLARAGLRSARWLILGVFPILYVIAHHTLGPLSPGFAVLTLLDALACALLLGQLSKPAERTLWAWIGLAVFVDGDFLKMIILARRLDDPAYVATLYPQLEWLTRAQLLHGYSWMTLGFVVYCLAATIALSRSSSARGSSEPDSSIVRLRLDLTLDLAAGVFLIYLLATLLQVKSGYGVLGASNQGLSGPVGATLTLYRRYLTPALLLLALWMFDRRKPMLARLVTLAILVAGVIDAFATSSRGSLVAFMLPVFLLFILTRRLTPSRRAFIGGTAIAGIVLFSIISAIRFGTSSTSVKGNSVPSISELVGSGTVVLARVQGAEGVWFALPFADTGLSLSRTVHFLHPPTMRDYYTYSVVGVTKPNTYEAPGLMGAFMIIGGAGGLIVLMIGFVFLVERSWSRIGRRFKTWPVALALTGSYLVGFMGEGTLLLGDLVKLGLVILTCELVYTRVLGRRKDPSRPRGDASPERGTRRRSGQQTAPAQRPAIAGP
jgi:hypothetical protein